MSKIRQLLIWIGRAFDGLYSRWCNLVFKSLGVKIKGYVWMRQIEIPRGFNRIELNDSVALDRGVTLIVSGDIKKTTCITIGRKTYINRCTIVDAIESITIGSHCAIGPNCYLTDHDHGIEISRNPLDTEMVSKPVIIQDSVWIGANVSILKGVTIGKGAVIGAGSVVTKDVPAQTIAFGNPCKSFRLKD